MWSAQKNARIAIVDDNPIIQQILVKTLEKYAQVRVSTEDIFPDGLSLLKGLSLRRYDLVLLDIDMPVMDGFQATRRIRSANEDSQHVAATPLLQAPDTGHLAPRSRPHTPTPGSRNARGFRLASDSAEVSDMSTVGIRILESNRRVPIVAVTANAFLDEQRRQCLAVGMDEVLSKPITPKLITGITRRYLDPDQIKGTSSDLQTLQEGTELLTVEPNAANALRKSRPSTAGRLAPLGTPERSANSSPTCSPHIAPTDTPVKSSIWKLGLASTDGDLGTALEPETRASSRLSLSGERPVASPRSQRKSIWNSDDDPGTPRRSSRRSWQESLLIDEHCKLDSIVPQPPSGPTTPHSESKYTHRRASSVTRRPTGSGDTSVERLLEPAQ
ncbi:hypothetical protein BC832DRAFT_204565 [Gaertneriomyces semiglobifer]|nr:hypothetical protein BC832DRAFT_204565 [Gaertneriomyces semiglobifer]